MPAGPTRAHDHDEQEAEGMRRVAGPLTILACAALAGCSSSVDVAAAPQATAPACRAAVEKFPDTVGGQSRVKVSPKGAGAGAWGDPAIIARCGMPPVPPTTTECIEVDGIGWIPERLSDGYRFTTFGTDPALEVLVPSAYRPETLLLPAWDEAAEALPTTSLKCR